MLRPRKDIRSTIRSEFRLLSRRGAADVVDAQQALMEATGAPSAEEAVREEPLMAADRFDIEERWPELFTQLDRTKRRAVVQSFAAAWHEGWEPNREDVENLTDYMRGVIDESEYERRSRETASRHRRAGDVSAG